MLSKKGLALITACAAMTCGGLVRADLAPTSVTSIGSTPLMMDDASMAPTSAPVATAPTMAPSGGLLMNGLRGVGIGKGLDGLGVVVEGYVEGSWTYSAHVPPGNILTDRFFDTKTESLQFDAVNLLITRGITYDPNAVTFGFTIEGAYGWDSAYVHSNGLTVYSPGETASRVPNAGTTTTIHPKAQLDLNQANFIIGLPVGYGLGFEGGKFDTLLGYEVIDGPANPLFSHSYIFTQEPFTHTGALGIYNVTDPNSADAVAVKGGITRGWEQSTKDNNGSIDYTGQIAYSKNDTNTKTSIYSLRLSAITGDESPSGTQDGWRTVLDVVGTYSFSDQLSFAANGMYAWQAQAANGGFGGGTGQWYGVAAYAKYVPPNIGNFLAVNARVEWFDDNDGAAVTQYAVNQYGAPTPNSNIPNHFYEATIGLAVTPLPNDPNLKGLTIRPELRWDYSDHSAFDDATQHNQWTAGVEAYFAF